MLARGADLGLKRERQAHQRAVKIDRRRRLAIFQYQSNTRNARSDLLERRRRIRSHGGTERGNKRRIAREIDGIAKALLGQQQYCFALDRLRPSHNGAVISRLFKARPVRQRHS